MSNNRTTSPAVRTVGPLPPQRIGPLGRCASCLDKALSDGTSPDLVPDAEVLVTVVQMFPVPGGQQIAAPVQMGVCAGCRRNQLGTASKTGLLRG
jgi:hypothetical protein